MDGVSDSARLRVAFVAGCGTEQTPLGEGISTFASAGVLLLEHLKIVNESGR